MDTFRKESKKLSTETVDIINEIKDQAQFLLDAMVQAVVTSESGKEDLRQEASSRELSTAKTNLEQAVMWAVKHWTA